MRPRASPCPGARSVCLGDAQQCVPAACSPRHASGPGPGSPFEPDSRSVGEPLFDGEGDGIGESGHHQAIEQGEGEGLFLPPRRGAPVSQTGEQPADAGIGDGEGREAMGWA